MVQEKFPHLLSLRDYAYRLLARRAYSQLELAEKLLAKGFSTEAVNRTVAHLVADGYVNDEALIADRIERLRTRGLSAAAIRAKLTHQGLPVASIEETIGQEPGTAEQDAARRLLASRFSLDALKQPQHYARAFRLLTRHGYAQDVIERALGEAPGDD